VATVRNVERRIRRIEGFDVVFRDQRGRNMRHNAPINPQYPYVNAAKNRWNVSQWITRRIRPHYLPLQVDVLKANGRRANGRTLLSTVRDTYLED